MATRAVAPADMLAVQHESTVTINTDSVTLTSSAFGKTHLIEDLSVPAQYDVTLMSAANNVGKKIAFLGSNATDLTRIVRIIPDGSETIDGDVWLMITPYRWVVIESDGSNWKIVATSLYRLADDLTIYLDSSMSMTLLQQYVDYAPRNINGYVLTFKFADGSGGTYASWTGLTFYAFFGGQLAIVGDSTSTTRRTNQSVALDGSGSGNVPILAQSCSALIVIQGFKITYSGSTSGIQVNFCTYAQVIGNYVLTSGATGMGMRFYFANGRADENYVNYGYYGIAMDSAILFSYQNSSITNNPLYGLLAEGGGRIGKYSATQPAGSTANERTLYGGEIA